MLKNKKAWLGLLISLFFLYLAFGNLKFDELVKIFQIINFWYIIAGILVFLIGIFVRSIRWSYQLNQLKKFTRHESKIPITPLTVFPALTIGYFANNILPARAGELFRTFAWSKKASMSKSSVLATILIERLFDGFAMITLATVSSLFLKMDNTMSFIVQFSASFFAGILTITLFFILFPAFAESLLDKVLKFLPNEKIRAKAKHIYYSFLDSFKILPNLKSVSVMFFLSILAWLLEALVFLTTALAFSINLPYYAFVFTGAIASLWTLIPSSPGYAGTFDFATIQSLVMFNLNPELAGSYTVVLHLVLWFPITLIGAYWAWKEGLKINK